MNEIVWLTEERTFGELITLGTYFSVLKYTHGGIDYEVLTDNNDFEYIEEEGEESDNT